MSADPMRWEDARRELPKEVFKVLDDARKRDPGVWELRRSGHKAVLVCNEGCCRIQVSGTPRVAQREAKDIARRAAQHPLPEGDPRRPLGDRERRKRS